MEIQGVRLTHPDKALWPADGLTKADLAGYFERMAPLLLRYAGGRPLTLRPFPRGVDRPGFYLKDAPKGAPPWLRTFRDVAESTGEPIDFVVADEARALVWLAQRNAVEVHAWLSRVERPDEPDWAVMDLDPPDERRWSDVVLGAKVVRDCLERIGLRAFPKLSGSSGLHVLVPLEPVHPFDTVRAVFERVAGEAAARLPDALTLEYQSARREGRVLLDYAQNARGKTTAAPYSPRPRRGAPVAMPVTWDELDDPSLRPDRWTLRTAEQRVAKVGDLLEPALHLRQRLPAP